MKNDNKFVDITDKVKEVKPSKFKCVKDWYYRNQEVIMVSVICANLFVWGMVAGVTLEESRINERIPGAIEFGTDLAWARCYFTDPEATKALLEKVGDGDKLESLAKFTEKLVAEGVMA